MASKPQTTPVAELSFEAALKELEQIVAKLETGEVELEESIEIYERGAALRAHCQAKLDEADLKIKQIVQTKEGIGTEAFDPG